jgi:hypothetical protein
MPTIWNDPFARTFRALLAGLSQTRTRYCVIGALAVGVWGSSRATQDIDCLALLDESRRARLLDMLRRQRFVVDTLWADQNPFLRDSVLRLRRGSIPIDLLLPRDSHDQRVLVRRRLKTVSGHRLWVSSPEDLILLKLKAARHRDFDDVFSVIVRQGRALDLPYLKQWGRRLGLWDELMYCLTQATASHSE